MTHGREKEAEATVDKIEVDIVADGHELSRVDDDLALEVIRLEKFRRRLKLAVMAALDQRIGTRFTIGGMNLEDTGAYIKGHLGFAGRSGPLFSEDAITVSHQASRGYPRTINNLALAALMATRSRNGAIVDLSAAQSAVREFSE